MAVTYLFQFLDKSVLGFTAIMGLREDLSKAGTDFSWAIWGVALILTTVCFNTSGLLANRFFLGVAEAAVAPGLSIIISMWYKRSEQPLRHGAWFLGNTVAGIFGGLFAYGIGHIQSIPAWKAVFIIFGAITIAWGVILFKLLPDVPSKSWFLTEEERLEAIVRIKENMTGIKSNKVQWYQCHEALLDIKLWLLVLIQLAYNIVNGGVQSYSNGEQFGSIIIDGMGFSVLNTLLVRTIAYSFQGVFVVLATTLTTYIPNIHTYVITFSMLIAIAGSAMIRQIDSQNSWARLMGYCLCMAYTINFPIVLAMSSANFGGFTKRLLLTRWLTILQLFIAYCTSNIIGPQLFFAREAPTYKPGFFSLMVCFAIATVACLALRFYPIFENRRQDQAGFDDSTLPSDALDIKMMDKTDKEIKKFRYVY
ncbi:unnamed protein product [Clonostachys rosea f. rosea IK726]|uniref:Major facilitator superfamily (MFS) profile domain-containing protein n=2 Tax=Bionectria ochroleuca TaxID=29856 RepID=A0A0B7KQX7_BIOOC|nr:unnamed protein product [Clonostachys rosea f. rosea IK726]